MTNLLALTAALLISTAAQATASTRSPNSLGELFAYLRQCLRLPSGTDGSEITLRFGLTHYGALKGKPMITSSRLVGDAGLQQAFVAASLAALENCTPVPVTEQFGRVIGQRVLTWRIRAGHQTNAAFGSSGAHPNHERRRRLRGPLKQRELASAGRASLS